MNERVWWDPKLRTHKRIGPPKIVEVRGVTMNYRTQCGRILDVSRTVSEYFMVTCSSCLKGGTV